jgi:hypothetical protein
MAVRGPEVAGDDGEPASAAADDPAPDRTPADAPAETVEDDPEAEDFGPPFEARSFGAEFAWAQAPGYTAKILRVRAGENVAVSTRGRRDMVAMLTGGRGVLEVRSEAGVDRVEMLPASPVAIRPDLDYRLIALTELELFTVYSPAS